MRRRRQPYPDLATFFEKTGTKQNDFAERLGISRSFLSEIKHGVNQPRLSLALRIAEAANVPVESLLKPSEVSAETS